MQYFIFIILALCILVNAVPGLCEDKGYVGKGVWYVRITNTDASVSAGIRAVFMLNRDPWTSRLYGSSKGWSDQLPDEINWLKPGESTDWLDLGEHMTTQTYFKEKKRYVGIHIGAIYPKLSSVSTLKLKIEIAKGSDRKIIRTIAVDEKHPNQLSDSMFLHLPPKLPTQSLLISPEDGEILTYEEAAENQLKWVLSAGAVKNHPVYCWFVSSKILPSGAVFSNPSRLVKTNLKIADALGYTNLVQYISEAGDDARLKGMGYPAYRQIYFHAHTDEQLKAAYEDKKGKDLAKYVGLVSFGDEVNAGMLQMPRESQEKLFVEWLKETDRNPMMYVHPDDHEAAASLPVEEQWKYVKLFRASTFWGNPEAAAKCMNAMQLKPELVYDSYIFLHKLWIEENRKRTLMAQQFFGKDILTGSNYNSANISPSQWIDIFKEGGLTTPWAEDWWWDLSAATPQSWGLVFAVMRRAAAFHDTPMIFYTIPDNAVPADHLLRMNYFAVAHQVKHLNHFCIYHQGYATCDYVEYAQSKDKFASFARINEAIGKVDKRLFHARVRPAQVAIIFSKPAAVWGEMEATCDPAQNPPTNSGPVISPSNYTLQQEEMKSIWLALRHANIPVDVITDDDISNGQINKYKAAFLVGAQMQKKEAAGLEEWVKKGGVLIGTCGAGLYDEYKQPIAAMNALYGVGNVKSQRTRAVVISGDILHIGSLSEEKPLDMVLTSNESLPAYCLKLNAEPTDAKVIFEYEDGSAAVVSRNLGKGKAVLCGFMPGLAYVRSALVMTEQGYPYVMPENYSADRRQVILSLLSGFKPSKPVSTNDYLVEATVQDGKYGSLVTLVNFRNKPAKVRVNLNSFPKVKKVVSTRSGTLPIKKISGIPSIELTVDYGDILTVD